MNKEGKAAIPDAANISGTDYDNHHMTSTTTSTTTIEQSSQAVTAATTTPSKLKILTQSVVKSFKDGATAGIFACLKTLVIESVWVSSFLSFTISIPWFKSSSNNNTRGGSNHSTGYTWKLLHFRPMKTLALFMLHVLTIVPFLYPAFKKLDAKLSSSEQQQQQQQQEQQNQEEKMEGAQDIINQQQQQQEQQIANEMEQIISQQEEEEEEQRDTAVREEEEEEDATDKKHMKEVDNDDDESEEDDGDDDFSSMFIDENYQIYQFDWQSVKFDLYHLNTSATQYDLTGQVIWPASEVLARFLIDKSEELNLSEKKILEFGAGAGLSGFAGGFAGCKVNVLTDDSTLPVIERLLVKNVDFVQQQLDTLKYDNVRVEYAPLRWGRESELNSIKEKYGTFDVLIGADTVYWPDSVTPLLQSIDVLLSDDPNARCYLAYVERSTRTCNELLDTARDVFHFNIEYLPDEEVDHKYKLNHLTAEKVKMIVIKRH